MRLTKTIVIHWQETCPSIQWNQTTSYYSESTEGLVVCFLLQLIAVAPLPHISYHTTFRLIRIAPRPVHLPGVGSDDIPNAGARQPSTSRSVPRCCAWRTRTRACASASTQTSSSETSSRPTKPTGSPSPSTSCALPSRPREPSVSSSALPLSLSSLPLSLSPSLPLSLPLFRPPSLSLSRFRAQARAITRARAGGRGRRWIWTVPARCCSRTCTGSLHGQTPVYTCLQVQVITVDKGMCISLHGEAPVYRVLTV